MKKLASTVNCLRDLILTKQWSQCSQTVGLRQTKYLNSYKTMLILMLTQRWEVFIPAALNWMMLLKQGMWSNCDIIFCSFEISYREILTCLLEQQPKLIKFNKCTFQIRVITPLNNGQMSLAVIANCKTTNSTWTTYQCTPTPSTSNRPHHPQSTTSKPHVRTTSNNFLRLQSWPHKTRD